MFSMCQLQSIVVLLLLHVPVWTKDATQHPDRCSSWRVMLLVVQIGWVTGPAPLISAIAKAHQFLVFTVPSNLQRAVAHGLDNESSFFT